MTVILTAPAVGVNMSTPFLPRNTRNVYIMLGNACNLNCRYCLQHPLVHEGLMAKVNPELYDFLEQLKIENSGSLRITFYGGEPLIYFKTIQEIVANTSYDYSIITNGKLLTPVIVDFLNENDFAVTISWDGRASKATRGFDVMESNRDTVLRINNLSISGVITPMAYPMELLEDFQDIDDVYEPLHGHHIGINLDELLDTGFTDKSLLEALNFKRIARETEALARLYFVTPVAPKNYTKNAFIAATIQRIHGNLQADVCTVSCDNGLSVLNVDLQGNLYPCHNTSEKIGDIHTPYYMYLQNLLKTDPTPAARALCRKCVAYPACRCGCKLVRDKTFYCKMKQALYLPMIKVFTEGVNSMEVNNP